MAHLGPLGQFSREYVSLTRSGSRRLARRSWGCRMERGLWRQADELPGAYLRLSGRQAFVSRPAVALRRILTAPSRGTIRRVAWADSRARDVAGRRPHLLHRSPDRR